MARSRSARHYLLDPRFQLKWTSYLVVVVLAVMAGLGFLIAKLASRASDTAQIAVTQAEKAFKESKTNNILARSAVEMAQPDNATLAGVMNESLKEVEAKQEKNLQEVRDLQAGIGKDRRNLQLLLGGAGLALVLLLTLMGIVITHRIVGPVHKMKRLLRRVGTGRLVVDERLRRGDELEDLFETFLQMTFSLKALQNARIATLDATLKRAEATGAQTDVLDGLRALRAQMVLGLEKRRRTTSLQPPPRVA
jgi:nitrogen fixation/metabolism regulation signal transduction histidine kinase